MSHAVFAHTVFAHTVFAHDSGVSWSAARHRSADAASPRFVAEPDFGRGLTLDAMDRDVLRLAAEAHGSTSPQAFRADFTAADWRRFGSYCVARRLPKDFRVLVPGGVDRTLHFLVEGRLGQASASGTRIPPTPLLPGAIVGEDTLFRDGPCELDVRTLEDSLVLELSRMRLHELTASHPEIAFELLRAAGAVISADGRASTATRTH